MATLAAIRFVSGSMRNRAGAFSHGTQTAAASTASLLVLQSREIVAETSFVFGSILVRTGVIGLVIQTASCMATICEAHCSTWIVATTWFVSGSMRYTIPSSPLVAHTDPAPAAMPFSVDKGSNGMVALTWSVCGSMRVMVPLAEAQTAP